MSKTNQNISISERARNAASFLGGNIALYIIAGSVLGIYLIAGIITMVTKPKTQPVTPAPTETSVQVVAETEAVEETAATTTETTVAETTAEEAVAESGEPEEIEESSETTRDPDELDPDLVAFCESYEAYIDEYCDFMERYLANPTDLNLLNEYVSIMETLDEFTTAADNYDTSDMTDAELQYYLEVTGRCTTRMLEVYF